MWTHLPTAENVIPAPLFASERVTFLDGTVGVLRSPLGGYEFTINPPDNYAVPLETKQVLEAAHRTGTPVHVVETYSDPGVAHVWPACTLLEARFTEMTGSNRTLFNYQISFLTGV